MSSLWTVGVHLHSHPGSSFRRETLSPIILGASYYFIQQTTVFGSLLDFYTDLSQTLLGFSVSTTGPIPVPLRSETLPHYH